MGMMGGVAGMANLFLGLAELLLFLRVILKFFFTSAGSSFVEWAYSTTNVLLAPFRMVFPDPTVTPTNWHIDWVALFAMAVYAAFASLLVGLAGWGFGASKRR
jgi:uncharacterized protein YggT (Ycf19 family)